MSLVLWSGGADSTLVLHDLALAYHLEKGTQVRSLGVNYEHIAGNKRFAKARKAILAVFERKGLKVSHSEIELSSSCPAYIQGGGGLIQPPVWLAFAQLMLEKDEDLYVGYIRGDDIWHHRQELVNIFTAAQAMTEKTGKLIFPLEWESKWQVIERLQKVELLSLCAWCESCDDDVEVCGQCASCKTHDSALQRLEIEERRKPQPNAVGCYKTDQADAKPLLVASDEKAKEPTPLDSVSLDCTWFSTADVT